jgi:hypothetical protein
MSGLPPVDAHDNKLLPAVYRRSDTARAANVAGRQSPPEQRDGNVALASDGADSSVYKRSRNHSPVEVKTGNSCPKGLIVDVWA